jgi:hypothetical protein
MDADDIGNLTGRPIPSTGIMAAGANGKLLRSYIVPYDISYMGMISLLLVSYIHRFDLGPAAAIDGRDWQDPENPY